MRYNNFKFIAILISTLVYLQISTSVLAQSPQKMSYQAVIRDGSNNFITSHAIGMRISILQDETPIYVETHIANTNENGLVTIEIGVGTFVSGVAFASIDWSTGTYSIKTETDPLGGTNYTAIVGISQLLSVPYALYSENSGTRGHTGATGATGNDGAMGPTGTNGINGATGATGPTGADGIDGATGVTGPTGSDGALNAWSLLGNTGTDASTNFIGTTDANDIVIKTNDTENMRITTSGNVGIGTSTPAVRLDVNGVINATGGNSTNWNTAFDWGNHAGLYRPIAYVPSWSEITNKPVGTNLGDMLYWNGTAWVAVPAGQPGQFLQFSSAHTPVWSGFAYPTITSTSVSSITMSTATSGGNITSDGGATVTARGVCWSTSANPTIADNITTDGSGSGIFTSSLTGLSYANYYLRAYATNSIGTAYGNEIHFSTIPIAVGDNYQGGKVAYILQAGDPGYITGEIHGLIAAITDIPGGAIWGCYGTTLSGANGTAIGTGNQNTIDILNGCSAAGIAAKQCSDLVSGGYSDWYLPSKDELSKLCLNKAEIGGFVATQYWSSSQCGTDWVWYQYIENGYSCQIPGNYGFGKYRTGAVRAIRSF